MRILITGVHGFVGSNLVRSLKSDHVIYGLDIIAPEKDGVIKTYNWDDLEKGNIPLIDAVIHLAGKADDSKDESLRDIYFKINYGLTKNIYDWFLTSQAKKFFFFSSIKAAADFAPNGVLTEDDPPAPVGPYGESKIAAEEYILKNLPADKQVYILRPCMIHGAGNAGNMELLYKLVNAGIPWPLGAFENKRSFTSFVNLAFVIAQMLIQNVPSGVYQMADDEALSTNELIKIIGQACGKKVRIWRINKGLMKFFSKIGGMLHLPLNPDNLNKLTENYVASNAKVKQAIGIREMPLRAKDGIISSIKSLM